MLEKIELIIFDMDGVLVDSRQMYLHVLQKALTEQGYEYPYNRINSLLGQKTEKMISDLIPVEDTERESKIRKAKALFDRLSCTEEGLGKVVLLPYAKEAIRELKRRNYLLALLTNSDRCFTDVVLKRYSLDGCWDKIIAADDRFNTKDDAAAHLIKLFNTSSRKTAYVADMVKDVAIARNGGFRIISIPGWNTEEMLRKAGPDYLIHNLKELIGP